jgi:hypothetical protein
VPPTTKRWSNRLSILLWDATLPVSSLECQPNVCVADSARARQPGEHLEIRRQMGSIKYTELE